MSTHGPISSDSSNKILNELPIIQAIPQIPRMANAFSDFPNNLLEDLATNPKSSLLSNEKSKSSSFMMSVKSKSQKTQKESKDFGLFPKASMNSSMNILPCQRCKSTSFSKGTPPIMPPSNKIIQRTFDYIQKTKEKIPSIYFSLNHVPVVDPVSPQRSALSLKSYNKNHHDSKTIKRNLLIYSTTKEKKKLSEMRQSQASSFAEPKSMKLFTNQKNLILKDMVFFEEGLNEHQKKNKKKNNKFKLRKCFSRFKTRIFDPFALFFKNFTNKYLLKSQKRTFLESPILWDLLVLLLLGFYYIWVPIELAFKINDDPEILFTVSGIFLSLDSVKKAIVHSAEKTKTRESLKMDLLFDVFSLVLLGLFLFDVCSFLRPVWAVGFIVLKIPEVRDNLKKIQTQLKMKKRLSFFIAVLIVLARIFCFANLTGCLWIYLGVNYKEHDLSWIDNILSSYSSFGLYFRSLSVNLANVTFIGLGVSPGLIIPTNSIEYIYSSFVTMTGFLFVWYNFRSCQRLFTKEEEDEKVNLNEFERILKSYGLDYGERMGFTKELGMVLSKNREQKLFGELLKMMSPSFQEGLLMRIYWPIIKKIPVLAKNFSKGFLVKLLHKIKIVSITPNETLFKERDYGNECLYYVISGEIECYVRLNLEEKHYLQLRTIKSNEYFREFSFFSNQAERFSAKSLTFSSILKIELHDFMEVLQEFPLDHENYISIKEKINTYGNFASLFLTCEGCNLKNHNIFDCPSLVYNPRRSYISDDFLSSQAHIDRRIYQRKLRAKQNALGNLKDIENQLLDFNFKYHDEIDRVLDEIYPSSDNEYSDPNQFNDSDGKGTYDYKSLESKESKYTNNDQVNMKGGKDEEFLGNPPSIFLQTPSKKSRKSMTESIFHETNDEGNEDDEKLEQQSRRKESKTDKTLNDLDIENEEVDEDEEYDDEEEKKGTSKQFFSTTNAIGTESRMSNTNFNAQSQTQKGGVRSLQKFFSERESKVVSEKDTYHVLQNFEKMSKINNGLTAQMTSNSVKKTSMVGSINSKSIASSNNNRKPILVGFGKTISSSSNSNNVYIPTRNKKTKHSDYLSSPLFAFDFDKPKEFRSFLPYNNMAKVIKRVEIDFMLKSGSKWGLMRSRDEETERKNKSIRSMAANTSLSSKKHGGYKETFES